MNKHTSGPLELGEKGDIWDSAGEANYPVAACGSHYDWNFASGIKEKEKASADLLVAAYNQYDKVAREWLGVDATELAEKMNLLTILREWAFFVKVHGTYGTLEASDVTRDLLAEKFKLEKVSR